MNTSPMAQRVAETRRRLSSDATTPDCDADSALVQFAIRVPARLRHLIHEAARTAGAPSTQQWVADVLTRAAAEANDPSTALHARYRAELSDRVAEKIRDGSYEQFAAAFDDPDLS